MTNPDDTTAVPSPGRWLAIAATGLLSGVVAALLMILLMAAARTWLGISPPPEALPDRFAPTIPIPTFFSLFDRFGGYNGLKRFGITSGLAGLFAVGAIVGVALRPDRREPALAGVWSLAGGFSRLAVGFIIAAALVLWVVSLALLWPVLDANYRGAPPGAARIASMAGAARRVPRLRRGGDPPLPLARSPAGARRAAGAGGRAGRAAGRGGRRGRAGAGRGLRRADPRSQRSARPSATTAWPTAVPACSRSRRTTSSTR